jgi:translation elongation factor aEF-1 beta
MEWGPVGNVLVTYRIMPDGPDVDTAAMRASVEKIGKVAKRVEVTEAPFAFGLRALTAKFVVEDGAGLTDAIEEQLNRLHGVSSVECLELGLI